MYKLYSDLHLDISQCQVESPCIIAGDIDGTPEVLGDISKVYSIKGNHDYWNGRHADSTVGTELLNEAVKLEDGRTLFGGTMWTEWAWPLSYRMIPTLPRVVQNSAEILTAASVIRGIDDGYNAGIRATFAAVGYSPKIELSQFNRSIQAAGRFMNDYRYGRIVTKEGECPLDQYWVMCQYREFLANLQTSLIGYRGWWEDQDEEGVASSPVGEDIPNHMLVMSHHCPVSRKVILRRYKGQRYDQYPELYPAYYSPAIARMALSSADFLLSVQKYGMTWVYGHTHEAVDLLITLPINSRGPLPTFHDSYDKAVEEEEGWISIEINTDPNYKDIPGVIRLVSNPRGYSTEYNHDQNGNRVTGVLVC